MIRKNTCATCSEEKLNKPSNMNTKTVVSIIVVCAVASALGVGWYATSHRATPSKTANVALTVDEVQA